MGVHKGGGRGARGPLQRCVPSANFRLRKLFIGNLADEDRSENIKIDALSAILILHLFRFISIFGSSQWPVSYQESTGQLGLTNKQGVIAAVREP